MNRNIVLIEKNINKIEKDINSMIVNINNIEKKNKFKLINVLDNLEILTDLGLNPKDVVIMDVIKNNKKGMSLRFKYGEMEYFEFGNVYSLSLKDLQGFIDVLDDLKTYKMSAVIVDKKAELGSKVISLTKQVVITNNVDPNLLMDEILFGIDSKEDLYKTMMVSGDLVFKYRVISISEKVYLEVERRVIKKAYSDVIGSKEMVKKEYLLNRYLPYSSDLSLYGKKINKVYKDKEGNILMGFVLRKNDNITIFVGHSKYDEFTEYRRIIVFRDDKPYLECLDHFYKGKSVFVRKWKDLFFYIDNEKGLLYVDREINLIPISENIRDYYYDSRFSTFDLETYIYNNRFYPYACGWYHYNNKVGLYYLKDYESSDQMFISCFKDLIVTNPGVVYVHNLSRFDKFFIRSILYKEFKVSDKYKDINILWMKLSIKIDNKVYSLTLKDSILLIQGSLRELGEKYNVDTLKSDFPYKFVNKNNLDYIGDKPDISYYEDISLEKYNTIPNEKWDIRFETLKYLENDLRCLYQIVSKFSVDIYKMEGLNITKISTISSLSFKIFKTNYLRNDILIYQVKGPAYINMRKAFYGGRVDLFIPHYITDGDGGCNVKCFDVNSLYPYSMLKPMPIGKPRFSNDQNLSNYFGIVYVKVESPQNIFGGYIKLKHPPYRIK